MEAREVLIGNSDIDKSTILAHYGNIDWLKSNKTVIHYFGLGFIQLKLGPNYRLHFYTAKLPPIVGHEDIHNHRYGFESFILKGRFFQQIYNIVEGDDYVMELESCEDGSESEYLGTCDADLIHVSAYNAGSRYSVSHKAYHSAFAEEAITLIRRPTEYAKDRATVVRPSGTPKVCPFSKKLPEAELWKIVEEMI